MNFILQLVLVLDSWHDKEWLLECSNSFQAQNCSLAKCGEMAKWRNNSSLGQSSKCLDLQRNVEVGFFTKSWRGCTRLGARVGAGQAPSSHCCEVTSLLPGAIWKVQAGSLQNHFVLGCVRKSLQGAVCFACSLHHPAFASKNFVACML